MKKVFLMTIMAGAALLFMPVLSAHAEDMDPSAHHEMHDGEQPPPPPMDDEGHPMPPPHEGEEGDHPMLPLHDGDHEGDYEGEEE